MDFTEKELQKIRQNEQEEMSFKRNFHSLLNGDKKLASRPLVIGRTPYSLALCGADVNLMLTINKKVINKAMRPEIRDENGKLIGKTGHGLTEDNVVQALNKIKNPTMIFKGTHDNSLLVITDIKDFNDRNIVVAVELNKKDGFETVNQILSPYGRDNLAEYIEKNISKGNLIAVNKEKAKQMLHSIEKWYLKENTFISFDNSIAYTTANVNYPEGHSEEKNIDGQLQLAINAKNPERSQEEANTRTEPAVEGVSQTEEKKSAKDLLAEQLTQGVKSVMDSDNYKNWLDTSSRLFTNNYSLRNAILIYMQKPDASYTMGYEAWKDYGRNVAQGAQGAKILVPVMAYEKIEGSLQRMILSNLRDQIKQNPGQVAAYRVGTSKVEFTMNDNGQVGLRTNGKEKGIFANQQEMKKFISNAVLGQIPMYYNVGTVFDVKDTIVPEHLWVKKGYTKDEVVKDKDGKPVKNKRGEVKIINTPERQAKFQPKIGIALAEQDPEKMAVLYDALKAVALRNGVPVSDVPRESDETLMGGADGYFSRQFDEKNPKGYIVMPDDLSPTSKCATLMHEMAHSDLHGNIAKLEAEMGNKVPRHMREIQAESVAYATAKQFGIETDTSSFKYLAIYTKGFELQDMQKSLDVIYKECQKLTAEIKTELDARGLNLDLTEKPAVPMEKESIETLCRQYTAYTLEQTESINSKMKELTFLATGNKMNTDLLSVLAEQKTCLDRQESEVAAIRSGVDTLQNATTREEQNTAIEIIEAAKRGIEGEKVKFSALTDSFLEISSQSRVTLKEEFLVDPTATLEAMKKDSKRLESLSAIQLSYVAQSEYIRKGYGNLLQTDPDKFIDIACQRAEALDKVIAKNGSFVEVNYCEQWTDEPIVQNGALIHPKVADSIVKQAEVQIQGLKMESEKAGDYFPFNKCDITVFTKAEDAKSLTAYRTRIDIGDGEQKSLADHLTQLCGKESQLLKDFEKATREKGAKEKIAFNETPEMRGMEENEKGLSSASTHEEWTEAIEKEKNSAQSQAQETVKPEQETQKDNDKIEH